MRRSGEMGQRDDVWLWRNLQRSAVGLRGWSAEPLLRKTRDTCYTASSAYRGVVERRVFLILLDYSFYYRIQYVIIHKINTSPLLKPESRQNMETKNAVCANATVNFQRWTPLHITVSRDICPRSFIDKHQRLWDTCSCHIKSVTNS